MSMIEPAAAAEITVGTVGDFVVFDGPAALVEQLVASDPALRAAQPMTAEDKRIGGVLDLLANALTAANTASEHLPSKSTPQLFRLDAAGQKLFEQGLLQSGENGFFRFTAQAGDGKFLKQATFKPAAIDPRDLANAQMALALAALTTAIKEVQAAVERVEDKVDRLQDHLDSEQIGRLTGLNKLLRRIADSTASTGTLSDTDWASVDDAAVEIEGRLDELRTYIARRLKATEEKGDGIAARATGLQYIEELSEKLALLLVAEDNLLLFQQLRLHRIREREPELFDHALASTTRLIDEQATADRDLVARLHVLTEENAQVRALEIHRLRASSSLEGSGAAIDETLRWFCEQRGFDYSGITFNARPTTAEAVAELKVRGAEAAEVSKKIASAALGGGKATIGKIKQRSKSDDAAGLALEAGAEPQALTAGESSTEPEPGDADDGQDASKPGLKDRAGSAAARLSGSLPTGKLRKRNNPKGPFE